MKRGIFIILILILALGYQVPSAAQGPGNPRGLLKGYCNYIKGEKFTYHSAQPDVTESMLVRSLEKELYIEWETEIVPADFNSETASFVFIACINVREDDPHSWDILADDKKVLSITTPAQRTLEKIQWEGEGSYKLEFKPVLVDRYGDLHGYMFLTLPAESLTPGKPLNLKAIGESSGNRAFFIVYRKAMEPGIEVVPEQAIRREGESLYQQVRINYSYLGEPAMVKIEAGEIVTETDIDFGYNSIEAKLPVVTSPSPFNVVLKKGDQLLAGKQFILDPVVDRTIYLLHHSHVDIGYTHVQDEVKRIQWEHLEDAIDLARESETNPEGARFRWNSEVMWAVESYLEESSPEKKKALVEAIRKGWIEPGALFANELTELCNSEELIQLTSAARKLSKEIGLPIESAMITDIPGWSWGLVPVLAKSGVKYLSLGTNQGHRIGSIVEEWGDRPFWWVSPSGEEKILCWINEKGYSLFHTGIEDKKFRIEEFSSRIFDYLNILYQRDYPYEIIPLRYSIGTDNGPADPDLCDLVMEWNSKFATPRIKISTVTEAFSEFVSRHGDEIPSVKGAFTGYWEDGAASSARETALNRKAAANINIINSLSVIKDYNNIVDETADLWRTVMLFDEHTWGSWNSISEPEDEFTLSQWAKKSSFAVEVEQASSLLKEKVAGIDPSLIASMQEGTKKPIGVEVVNSHSWMVSGIIEIPSSWGLMGLTVKDENGNTIPSQKLSSGIIIFKAENVPPFGSKVYGFEDGAETNNQLPPEGTMIENDMFRLWVDPGTGSISSLFDKKRKIELVDNSSIPGFNSYYYVAGRSPLNRMSATGNRVSIVEDGELVSVIRSESTAPGCNSLVSYYTIVKGVERVYIETIIDKIKTYDPEGVHLAFPFNVPGGEMWIDLAFGSYRPGKDQLRGANKNYFTPEKWVDISNKDYGVTLVSLDAPLVEIGDITTDATAVGWIQDYTPSQLIYSYVMNNYWETNYLAAQEGKTSLRYVIGSHDMFNFASAEKMAAEESEKLVVIPLEKAVGDQTSLFTINSSGVIATALIQTNDGYMIRLFNTSGHPENLNIKWNNKPEGVWVTDFDGDELAVFSQGLPIPAWGIRTLKVK